MMRFFIFIMTCLVANQQSLAQYYSNYNKVWAFGYKAGLDFTSGAPVAITTGDASTSITEGCASVCDSLGNLLFYTKGTSVYNRNHVLMPSGVAVTSFSTFSTTQAALIMPVIDSPQKYYVFSLQQFTNGDPLMCKLVYCKVDMNLDGGFGDIVVSTKETPLADSLCEKMIAIAGDNHNIWLMVHRKDTCLFLAYEISTTGIDTIPVVSTVGTFSSPMGYAVGTLKVSPNRRKIVSNSVFQSIPYNKFGTELYDFDPSTGIVSNCLVLDSVNSHYGAEFSPDNSKLYTDQRIAIDTMKIVQYNIGLSGLAAIKASKTDIATISRINGCDMKLGPDRKIYLISDTFALPLAYSRYMSCISSPNLSGMSCGYTPRAIVMAPGTGMQLGLPNVYVTQDTNYVPVEIEMPVAAKNTDFFIFPNPVTTELSVIGTEMIKYIKVTNSLGQDVVIKNIDDKSVSVDVRQLQTGLHWVNINGVTIKQFLKL